MTNDPVNPSSMTQNQLVARAGRAKRDARQKVLVIGATGYLGRKILNNLLSETGIDLRAMSRKGAPTDADTQVEWVRGDMLDPASLDAALQGVDVVVSSANGYMKETLDADFQGNKNLIDAVARAGVQRFVFLSIVASEHASKVPHFHAKKVAEDLIKAAGIPYVFVRAPAFLDQSTDYLADGVKAGRMMAMGDKTTRWSYVLTDDLAADLAKAAAFPGDEINNQTIDVGWRDGAKSQKELAEIVADVTGVRLSVWTIPWFIFRTIVRPIKLFSELGYDIIQMFLFFKTGRFVSDITKQEQFFGPAPTSRDAISRWAQSNDLIKPQY